MLNLSLPNLVISEFVKNFICFYPNFNFCQQNTKILITNIDEKKK